MGQLITRQEATIRNLQVNEETLREHLQVEMYQSDGAKMQHQYDIWSLCTVLDFQADEYDSLKRRWEELSASSRQQQEQINHLTQVNGESSYSAIND